MHEQNKSKNTIEEYLWLLHQFIFFFFLLKQCFPSFLVSMGAHISMCKAQFSFISHFQIFISSPPFFFLSFQFLWCYFSGKRMQCIKNQIMWRKQNSIEDGDDWNFYECSFLIFSCFQVRKSLFKWVKCKLLQLTGLNWLNRPAVAYTICGGHFDVKID